jgi:mRNA interferase RelE/StbE
MTPEIKGVVLSKYRVFETDQYLKDLTAIGQNIQKRIIKKINSYVYPQLIENPYFGLNIKKLKDYSPETWRYRIGTFRLFYEIDEQNKTIFIIGIDPRKDAY